MTVLSHKEQAMEQAAIEAVACLAAVDLTTRCPALGLPVPAADGVLRFTMLGRAIELTQSDFAGRYVKGGQPLHPVDRLLLLHYLGHDRPLQPRGKWVAFRAFPGGPFYWGPFRARTTEPLVREIGNDLALLKKRLARYNWRPLDIGEPGIRINAFANVEVGLVYRAGDEEFGPSADVLFDASLTAVFAAEDAVALANRVCFGLMERGCSPCAGCGLCNE